MTTPEVERELIKDVVENPASDAPRLAYADWLDSHGQRARARLIRVQCQREQLQVEERELIEAHGEEWGRPLRDLGVGLWAFHRGFPEEIDIPVHTF